MIRRSSRGVALELVVVDQFLDVDSRSSSVWYRTGKKYVLSAPWNVHVVITFHRESKMNTSPFHFGENEVSRKHHDIGNSSNNCSGGCRLQYKITEEFCRSLDFLDYVHPMPTELNLTPGSSASEDEHHQRSHLTHSAKPIATVSL